MNKKNKLTPNELIDLMKVKHLSEYYDEYMNTKNIDIFRFYLDDDGVWRRTELKWLFDYLLKHEEYEKCLIVNKLMEEHYIANVEETNYLNNKLINNEM